MEPNDALSCLLREDAQAMATVDVNEAVRLAVQHLLIPAAEERDTSDKLREVVEMVTRQWLLFLEEDTEVSARVRAATTSGYIQGECRWSYGELRRTCLG